MSGIDKTGFSNQDYSESLIDPLANPNIMTAEAAMAIIKAGFLKPKDESELRSHRSTTSKRTNSYRNMATKSFQMP